MDANCNYAFIDESGNADKKVGRMLVISAVITDNRIQLARTFKKAEKKYRSEKAGKNVEMKAFFQQPITRKRMLSSLENCDFSIYSLIFDLSTIDNVPYKYDDIYKVGMSMLCCEIYSHYHDIHFILDKRYTNETLRNSLDESIEALIRHNYGSNIETVNIFHGDSAEFAELRVADFIAYETYQKYKFGSEIYDIFSCHVKKMMFYSNITWGKIKKESKTPLIKST